MYMFKSEVRAKTWNKIFGPLPKGVTEYAKKVEELVK